MENYLKTKFKSGNFGKLNFDMYIYKKIKIEMWVARVNRIKLGLVAAWDNRKNGKWDDSGGTHHLIEFSMPKVAMKEWAGCKGYNLLKKKEKKTLSIFNNFERPFELGS